MRSNVMPDVFVYPTGVADLRERCGRLFSMAWDEIDGQSDLRIDWDQYSQLETMGLLRCLAIDVDGEIAAYGVMSMLPAMNSDGLVADVLSAFADPQRRSLGIGMKLIRAMESSADAAGVDLRWHTKAGHTLETILASRKGYSVSEIVYTRSSAR